MLRSAAVGSDLSRRRLDSRPSALLWTMQSTAPGATGVGRYVMELASALLAAPRSIDYEVCAPREAAEPDWLPPGHHVRRVRAPRRMLHGAWLTTGHPNIERVAGPADLVHALHPGMPVPSRSPSVITLHDMFPLTDPEWFAPRHRFTFRRAVELAEDRATAVLANSQATADATVELFPGFRGRISVVHLGISPAFREVVDPADIARSLARARIPTGPYALALGRVVTRKNLPTLVRALREVPPPLRLVVAGPDGNGVDALGRVLDDTGLGERVTRVRWLPQEDVVPVIAGASMLVHASLAEGFGFTPLEAMSLGTPALVSSSAALDDVLGGAAELVPTDDATAWAAAMVRVATEDPALRAARIANGREWAAGFTWERTAALTAELHEQILGSAG